MSDTDPECTNDRRRCDACDRAICRRCSRCFEKYREYGHSPPPTTRFRCPSRVCRLLKRLSLSPYRVGETPRTGVCTDPADSGEQ